MRKKSAVWTAWMLALALLLAGMACTVFAEDQTAAEEYEEIFAQWNPEAPALNALIDYVEAVTDEASPDYIPPEDRIATFDMDGTLMGELYPTYLEYYMLAWRILKDPTIQPDEEMLEVGRTLRDCALDNSFPEDMAMQHAIQAARAYAGMTLSEFADFVTEILLRDVDGFEGMTYGESFYLPMVEVVEYLQENGFKCYICSGSDRFICRTFIEGMLDIPYENIIGMDVELEATGQGDEAGLDYVFSAADDVVRTDRLLIKNLKTNKVLQIAQEIGRQPVLSFGNSSGDVSMHNYVIYNNVYKSAAFMLVADDDVRDYGSPEKAAELREKWEDQGFHVISMANDWKTIYGENVVKTGVFRWMEELAEDTADGEGADGLRASIQEATDSPEWVTSLPSAQAADAAQLFVIAGMGTDKTTATVSMHERDENGNWQQILSTPAFVGKYGLCADADHEEGCGQTPMGVYTFNRAFGIADDPGCAIPYVKVDEDTYWSGDDRDGMHYNEMVDIKDYPDLNMENSEHIVDYDYEYQYCLNISFNEDGTPGRGSAIFLHCLGAKKPYTGGCVAVPENIMKLIMQKVKPDCVVIIDTLENLTGDPWIR